MDTVSSEDLHRIIRERLQELFTICDPNNRSYITLDDMLANSDQLPITPEQMKIAFETLDKNRTGYLTMDAFVDGLSAYLKQGTDANRGDETEEYHHHHQQQQQQQQQESLPDGYQLTINKQDGSIQGESKDNICNSYQEKSEDDDTVYECDVSDPTTAEEIDEFLLEMGMTGNLKYEKLLKTLWPKVRNDPNMSSHFEEFVEQVFLDIQEAKANSEQLQTVLKNKHEEYDSAIKSLFEEMESQISKEKEKARREEEAKEKKLRDKLESELNEKNRLLLDLVNAKENLKHRIEMLSTSEDQYKEEKERLLKENRDLSRLLKESQDVIRSRQKDIEKLAEEGEKERKARIRSKMRMSAGLAKEYESLKTQLLMLQEMNQQLKDDKDALLCKEAHQLRTPKDDRRRLPGHTVAAELLDRSNPKKATIAPSTNLARAGSLMSKYFPYARKRIGSNPITDDEDSSANNSLCGSVENVNVVSLKTQIKTTVVKPRSNDSYQVKIWYDQEGEAVQPDGDEEKLQHADDEELLLHAEDEEELLHADDEEELLHADDEELLLHPYGEEKLLHPYDEEELLHADDEEELLHADNEEELLHADDEEELLHADGEEELIHDDEEEEFQRGENEVQLQRDENKEQDENEGVERDGDKDTEVEHESENHNQLHDIHQESKRRIIVRQEHQEIDTVSESDEGCQHRRINITKIYQESYVEDESSEYESISTPTEVENDVFKKRSDANHITLVTSDEKLPKITLYKSNGNAKSPTRKTFPTKNSPEERSSPTEGESNPTNVMPITQSTLPEIYYPSPIEEENEYVLLKRTDYKLVFVGDSGVGKSSFVQNFCTNEFNTSYSATIAIDFQVKTLQIDGVDVMLQLWDTAGHERFRSLTKSYFRKADGIIIMYDIGNELSFANIREWMFSVEDGKEDYAIVMIIGNKLDLPKSQRCVHYKIGQTLAKEYNAMFTETSAKIGSNLSETMAALSRRIMKVNLETRLPNVYTRSPGISPCGSTNKLAVGNHDHRHRHASVVQLEHKAELRESVKKKCCSTN